VLSGLAPARRRLVLGLLVVSVAVVAVAAVLVPRLWSAPTAVAQDRPGPVLLVPGYGGATAGLEDLAGRLRAAGRDATVVPVPGDGTGDMQASADALGTAVQRALDRTRAGSVDVVGYSAGGVIARLWAADGGAGEARRIVTLGAPQHGTQLADLAGGVLPGECPAGCRQLSSTSDLLRRLNAGDETPNGPTWVSIWTTQDQTVLPPDSARLEGAVNIPVQSVCSAATVGHGQLPTDRLVQQMVLTELRAGPAVPLGADDCARLTAAADATGEAAGG
jgi:triacylglycerol esterase/lipase EstA (alpha/beta hydrolase family)